MTFNQQTVSQFLAALASSDPTPGGGTASAIAGAMGASLLIMVAGLPKPRTGSEEEREALAAARLALEPLAHRLRALGDEDSAAYDQVTAAYRLPKSDDQEKAVRAAAIQAALTQATVVPLDTLRVCAAALEHGVVVARHGHSAAASDAGVGLGLLEAAAHGAAANVRANVTGLKDPDRQVQFSADTEALLVEVRDRLAVARTTAR